MKILRGPNNKELIEIIDREFVTLSLINDFIFHGPYDIMIMTYLIDKGIKKDSLSLRFTLHKFIQKNNFEIVKYIIDKYIINKIPIELNNPIYIHSAVRNSDLKIIKYLVENGAELDIHCFLQSANNPFIQEVIPFLFQNIEITDKNKYELLHSSLLLDPYKFEYTKILVENGAKIRFDGDTLLDIALKMENNKELVLFLIKNGGY
jgi:ankyrin repeat protein